MIDYLIDSRSIVAVMTPFGAYEVESFEIMAFMHVYAGERSRHGSPKWQEELIDYATKEMEARWQ